MSVAALSTAAFVSLEVPPEPATNLCASVPSGHARRSARIPGLDGLRAVSISMVLLGHMVGTHYFLSPSALRPFGDIANLGVRTFFVVSGFLITGLLLREVEKTGTISLIGFYRRRTIRIFPAFYAFIAVMVAAQTVGAIQLNSGDLIHAVTYTTNYHYTRAWWLGHLWSLSVEEQFYLIWPAAMLLCGTRRALYGAAGVVLLAPVARLAMFVYEPGWRPAIGESFPTIADAIATGCLVAGCTPLLMSRTWFRRLVTTNWFYCVPALAFLLNMKRGGRISLSVLETVINISLALCVVRFTTITQGMVSKVLNSKPMVTVGLLSYSIYLWQQPFLNHHSSAALMSFPLNIGLVALCAATSYHFIEKPIMNWGHAPRERSHWSLPIVGWSH
jgi:peptidoglycan/LPS O-acetylase OafA/YrhL